MPALYIDLNVLLSVLLIFGCVAVLLLWFMQRSVKPVSKMLEVPVFTKQCRICAYAFLVHNESELAECPQCGSLQ
ncbi:MAG: hypothetical protein JW937_06170 [Candidatus Omnitrophica bacterium]|nr:hypothetical protein [Candidatus Omnitrophota bacterium]